jgi:hypothetical protein
MGQLSRDCGWWLANCQETVAGGWPTVKRLWLVAGQLSRDCGWWLANCQETVAGGCCQGQFDARLVTLDTGRCARMHCTHMAECAFSEMTVASASPPSNPSLSARRAQLAPVPSVNHRPRPSHLSSPSGSETLSPFVRVAPCNKQCVTREHRP